VVLTGTIKAVKTAMVKVRVAGEVTQLTLREGDTVKAGQVVARIDPGEAAARLRQVSDQAESARAQVDIAQRQYDNNQSLVQQGFISKTALENAVASLAGAKASYQAAKAAVELAQRSLDDTVLRAPINGVVAAKGVQNGERAGIEARVIDIVDLSQMELEAALPAEDAAAVRIGQTARVVVEGAADAGVEARVVRINPSVQAGSRSVMVYLSVAPHPALKNGVFAQGSLAVGQTNGVAVPVSAIRLDKPKPYVQVVEGEVVVHKTVVAGPRGVVDGQPFALVEGLPTGTVLLSGTVGVLREGTRVKVIAPTAGK
jgi:RND family efflux transporter MFP subunit